MFAKLYGEDDDQVLVTIMQGDEGPEVKWTFAENGAIVTMAARFDDTNSGWDSARAVFDRVDESKARKAVDEIRSIWIAK